MALEVEDGTGKADAESVLSVTDLDTMATRENWPNWPASGQQVPAKEAALRQASRWMESRFRTRIQGAVSYAYGLSYHTAFQAFPKSTTQRLLFPMTSFVYPDGRTLSVGEWLPPEWALGNGLAARRAFLGTLSPDLKRGGRVISKTVGPLNTQWEHGAPAETTFPEIEDALRPLWAAERIVTVRA